MHASEPIPSIPSWLPLSASQEGDAARLSWTAPPEVNDQALKYDVDFMEVNSGGWCPSPLEEHLVLFLHSWTHFNSREWLEEYGLRTG